MILMYLLCIGLLFGRNIIRNRQVGSASSLVLSFDVLLRKSHLLREGYFRFLTHLLLIDEDLSYLLLQSPVVVCVNRLQAHIHCRDSIAACAAAVTEASQLSIIQRRCIRF